MLFILHNVEVSLNDEFKTNVADYFRRFANRCAQTMGYGIKLCSCVQTVLTIGQKLTGKGVVGRYVLYLSVSPVRGLFSAIYFNWMDKIRTDFGRKGFRDAI